MAGARSLATAAGADRPGQWPKSRLSTGSVWDPSIRRDDRVRTGRKPFSAARRRVFTSVVRRISDGPVRVAVHPIWVGVAVRDVLFVLLTLVVFGLLALVAKGAEKL